MLQLFGIESLIMTEAFERILVHGETFSRHRRISTAIEARG
jgi:hypothetical protein